MSKALSSCALSSVQLVRRALPAPLSVSLSAAVVIALLYRGGHDDQRLIEIGFFLLAFPIMLAGRARAVQWAPPLSFTAALLCLAALGLVSSLLAFSPLHGLQEVSALTLQVLIALFVGRELATQFDARLLLVLRIVALGCAIYFSQILVVWGASLLLRSQPDVFSFSPGFSNYRFLNHAQTILLPMLVLFCCKHEGRLKKAGWLVAACWWGLLILLAGRGTFVGLVAGCIVTLCLRRTHATVFCRTMVLTGVAGLVLYLVFCFAIPRALGMEPFGTLTGVVERSVADPASSRLQLWSAAIEMIAAHPGLGVGPMHYAHYSKYPVQFGHPHNWVFQIAAEWGIPALLLLVWALFKAISALLARVASLAPGDQPNQLVASALIFTGTAILVDACVSGLLVMPVSQLLITLYCGCALGWYGALTPAAAQPASRRARLILALLIVASVSALAATSALKGPNSGPPTGDMLYPRYWVNGNF